MDIRHFRSEFLPGTLTPSSVTLQFSSLCPFTNPFRRPLNLTFGAPKQSVVVSLCQNPKAIPNLTISSQNLLYSWQDDVGRRDLRSFAGRSKKKPGGSSGGRIEGDAEFRRRIKLGARRKSKKLAESLFYRLKNPNKNYADNFSEDELQQIGLGYDRLVRFMKKDDPNLRHPYDWYKYGEYGPFSWRGVVVGDPIRGRFTDERVTIIGNVKDHEEWEKIEQSEMVQDFGKRLKQMDESKGFRYFWVFVRHPRWRLSELPWQQWTLVSEVVVEAGKQRLDKWSLMGRLGNTARSLITKCAAWMRPDIIYVKRPVYQCRFEPQDNFFKPLIPFLDPKTEQDYLFELENDDGTVEMCTYFGGLCKIVKANQKAFVDDVVNAYQKLSDEKKSKCLEFLLTNHPVELLHPYTKEWKSKLEEMELGCDAPDDEDDDASVGDPGETEIVDWIEDDYGDGMNDNDNDDEDEEDFGDYDDDDDDDDDNQDLTMNMAKGRDGRFRVPDEDTLMEEDEKDWEEDTLTEEDEKDWEEEFRKATRSADAMEKLAKRSAELSSEMYRKRFTRKESPAKTEHSLDGDETSLRGKWAKVNPQEWKQIGIGPYRKRIKKSKIPPELFVRAAVRPFTYRNLVKEIVLTRHAILDGDIGN